MRTRALNTLFTLALIGLSALGLAHAGAPKGGELHDGPRGMAAITEEWLPRHRALIATRRDTYPAARLPAHAPARLSFRKPRRISSDILAPPSADLTTAQAETQTEPYVAVNPEDPDHLVAGWQETRFFDGGARSLGVAVSTNGGRSWTDALLPGLALADGGVWERASDPWPAFGPDGLVYYNSLLVTGGVGGDNAIGVSVSRDGGFTWAAPVEIVRDAVDFNDKNSMVVDTGGASPHRGTVYVGWDVNLLADRPGFQRTVVARSTDEGANWSAPVKVVEDDVSIGIVMRVAPDGTLYAVWTGASPGDPNLSLFLSRSRRGGKRFSKPTKIADLLAVGVPGYRGGAILPSFDVDPLTGDLYVVWADSRFTGADQATLSISRDGGRSWSDPGRVSDGPGEAGATTIGVATNALGELLVGYYSLRNDAGNGTSVDYYVNRSTDGGRSFEAGIRVNRKTFDAGFAARSGSATGSIFLGDYVGLAGTDDGFVAVFTAPLKRSKLGRGKQPDIFGAASR